MSRPNSLSPMPGDDPFRRAPSTKGKRRGKRTELPPVGLTRPQSVKEEKIAELRRALGDLSPANPERMSRTTGSPGSSAARPMFGADPNAYERVEPQARPFNGHISLSHSLREELEPRGSGHDHQSDIPLEHKSDERYGAVMKPLSSTPLSPGPLSPTTTDHTTAAVDAMGKEDASAYSRTLVVNQSDQASGEHIAKYAKVDTGVLEAHFTDDPTANPITGIDVLAEDLIGERKRRQLAELGPDSHALLQTREAAEGGMTATEDHIREDRHAGRFRKINAQTFHRTPQATKAPLKNAEAAGLVYAANHVQHVLYVVALAVAGFTTGAGFLADSFVRNRKSDAEFLEAYGSMAQSVYLAYFVVISILLTYSIWAYILGSEEDRRLDKCRKVFVALFLGIAYMATLLGTNVVDEMHYRQAENPTWMGESRELENFAGKLHDWYELAMLRYIFVFFAWVLMLLDLLWTYDRNVSIMDFVEDEEVYGEHDVEQGEQHQQGEYKHQHETTTEDGATLSTSSPDRHAHHTTTPHRRHVASHKLRTQRQSRTVQPI